MPGHKRTDTEREEALAEVARLDRRGYSQRAIAGVLGVTQPQVCYDLKVIRKRYAQATLLERSAKVAEKEEQYREVREEAWLAWERSKEDASRRVEKRDEPAAPAEGESAPGAAAEVTETTEGRLPANEYLRTVAGCLQAERELLGLDAPKQVEVGGREGAGPVVVKILKGVSMEDL